MFIVVVGIGNLVDVLLFYIIFLREYKNMKYFFEKLFFMLKFEE